MRKLIISTLALSAILCIPAVAQTSDGNPEPQTTDPIVKRPQGRLMKNQVRKAMSFYSTGSGAYIDSVDYYIGDYVMGDDGSVYLKNPFTFFPTQSYLKLDRLEGDTLVARMPQAIYREDDTYYVSRLVARSEERQPRHDLRLRAECRRIVQYRHEVSLAWRHPHHARR